MKKSVKFSEEYAVQLTENLKINVANVNLNVCFSVEFYNELFDLYVRTIYVP